jgi:sugar-specific transcriptional regulator TrmB
LITLQVISPHPDVLKSEIKNAFKATEFIQLDDERLLSLLSKDNDEIRHLLAVRDPKNLYKIVDIKELSAKNFRMTTDFIEKLKEDPDQLSDVLLEFLDGLVGKLL